MYINFIIDLSKVFKENFYSVDYFIDKGWYLELLPEIVLIIFILYGVITVFNDNKKPMLQYYRWCIFLVIVLICILIQCLLLVNTTKIMLGFTLINCYYTIFSKFLVIVLTVIILISSYNKLRYKNGLVCIIEFPLVVGFSIFFLFLLTSSYDFFGVYLAIEGLSLTLYTMAGILYRGIVSIEAAIKYYSLGAVATGIMLFGISGIFGIVGSLDFLDVQMFLGSCNIVNTIVEFKLILLCVLFGFFFKVSSFPCHIWVADVYEGVWTPITAFFAIVIKIALLLFYIRVMFNVMFNIMFAFQNLLVFVSLGSLLVGSLGALKQVRIKRFIAYTSINQVGFIFLGVACCNLAGIIAAIMYILLYAVMSVSFFSIILNIEHVVTGQGAIYLSDLYSVALYNSENAKHLVVILLSMAGLPPMGGFIGKLLLYFAAMEARLDWAVFFSMVIGVISTYYYLSCIRHIWFEKTRYIRLYFFNKNIFIRGLLRVVSLILCCFILIVPTCFLMVVKLAVSALFPFIWY